MGYEMRLIIGKEASVRTPEYLKSEHPVVEDGEIFYPHLLDDEGRLIPTGNTHTYFRIDATVDLCKLGNTHLDDLEWTNDDDDHYWFWFFDGNIEQTEDCYGVKPKPVPVEDVLVALKRDYEESGYRRLKWAIGLLETMAGDTEELQVLVYGY